MRLSGFLFVICSLIAAPATAAGLSGIVVDTSGAPIPGATVTATPDSGPGRGVTTGDDGLFEMADLPDGLVTVRATAAMRSTCS